MKDKTYKIEFRYYRFFTIQEIEKLLDSYKSVLNDVLVKIENWKPWNYVFDKNGLMEENRAKIYRDKSFEDYADMLSSREHLKEIIESLENQLTNIRENND